jgi:hypothetical protein
MERQASMMLWRFSLSAADSMTGSIGSRGVILGAGLSFRFILRRGPPRRQAAGSVNKNPEKLLLAPRSGRLTGYGPFASKPPIGLADYAAIRGASFG